MEVAIVARLLAAAVFDHGRQISGAQNLVLEKDWPLNPVAHFLPPLCLGRRLSAALFFSGRPTSSFSSSTAFSLAFFSAGPGASTPTAPAGASAAASGPTVNARPAVPNETD